MRGEWARSLCVVSKTGSKTTFPLFNLVLFFCFIWHRYEFVGESESGKRGMAIAEQQEGGEPMQVKSGAEGEVVSVELPAPPGWTKKFVLNEDGTPSRNEIVFISPTGEEIKHKRQLQQYLKEHPGGPTSSEFDWGTGETPRRSARIREKVKAVETPEEEKPRKRERKSSSKKGTKEKKDDGHGEDEASMVKEGEAKASTEVDLKESGNEENKVTDEGVPLVAELNESASIEFQVNQDTTEVVTEVEAEKDSEMNSNGNVPEKSEAGLQNNGETNPGVDITVSVPEEAENKDVEMESAVINKQDGETSSESCKHKDPEAVVIKEAPSISDGQHLPKASPVNC